LYKNANNLEYWKRCRALPLKSPERRSSIQPEIEKKEKNKKSVKPQASSSKRQALDKGSQMIQDEFRKEYL